MNVATTETMTVQVQQTGRFRDPAWRLLLVIGALSAGVLLIPG